MAVTAASNTPAAFGTLLRAWRAARKVSQLELSLAATVSQRHLSFLESGRARPSRQMVLQLAETLEVPLRERNALLTAAGFAPFYCERSLEDAAMKPVRDALEQMLAHHQPYPAVVVDRDYDLVLANPAFDSLVGIAGDPAALWQACCGDRPRNLLRLTFHRDGVRPFIRNFDAVGPMMLARSWREAAARGGPIGGYLETLRQDPDIPPHWHTPDPSALPPPVMPLELARGGMTLRLFAMIATFGTPYDVTTDELRVETFFPADAASEALLRARAAT